MKFNKIDAEYFSYYADSFHDGSVFKIQKNGNDLLIEMESAPIFLCENRDSIPLSKDNTLYGVLHVIGIKKMKKNKEKVSSLEVQHEYGDILEFILKRNFFSLCGNWDGREVDIAQKEVWFDIEVEATEIYWENTANMHDTSLLGKYIGIPEKPPDGYPQWYIDKHGLQEDKD